FWLDASRSEHSERALWVGAGTRDTGFSLTRLTFQITHATDADTNMERDFIVAQLAQCGAIRHAVLFKPGDRLERVNHYIADGEVAVAEIASDESHQVSNSSGDGSIERAHH